MLDRAKFIELINEIDAESSLNIQAPTKVTIGIDPLTANLAGLCPPETQVEVDRLKIALGSISADMKRDEWMRIIWAIQSTGWQCAENLAKEWSKTSSKFDELGFYNVFNSFEPGKAPTVSTIYFLAQQNELRKEGQPLSPEKINAVETVGDVKNAERFCSSFQGQLMYVANTNKWLKWQYGHGFVWCETNEPMVCAVSVAKAMVAEAATMYMTDQEKAKTFMAHATRSNNLPRLEAMLQLASAMPGMVTTIQNLDSDPWKLGVRNGIVDLKNGQLLLNTPDMLISRFCNAKYDREAHCDKWLAFLNEIFEGDLDTITTIQRALGYTLTGSVTEEKLFVCFGIGANGKSVFSNVVATILGGYARTAPTSLLVARRSDDSSPRNDLAALTGARYVAINEMQSGDRLDEQIVKQLAGREPIAARFLHKEFFEYLPTFTPWLRTNHRPVVRGDDEGIWRRLVLIPFRRNFTPSERDPDLEQKLLAERDGILYWMIEGALAWQKNGLELSHKIQVECNTYRTESDLLGQFLSEQYAADLTKKSDAGAVFLNWQSWCNDNGIQPGAKASLTRRLSERGYGTLRSNGRTYYIGLKSIEVDYV